MLNVLILNDETNASRKKGIYQNYCEQFGHQRRMGLNI